jgi:hypothetical protein
MTITEREFAGTKLTYHHWTRDTASANAGTVAVTHSSDLAYHRMVTIIDMLSNGGIPSKVPDDQYAVVFTDATTTTITNNCGTASIGTMTADGGNTGVATFTEGGTYTGVADGVLTVTCVNGGEIDVAVSIGSAVYAGTGSATSETAAGTYTGWMNGDVVLTCCVAGELGTARFNIAFPDGAYSLNWLSGATTVAKTIGQGITLAMTSGVGTDCVVGDTVTIPVVSKPSITAVFPDGTSVTTRLAASGAATTLAQGVTATFTADTGTDTVVADFWTILLAAASKDLKVIVSLIGD